MYCFLLVRFILVMFVLCLLCGGWFVVRVVSFFGVLKILMSSVLWLDLWSVKWRILFGLVLIGMRVLMWLVLMNFMCSWSVVFFIVRCL